MARKIPPQAIKTHDQIIAQWQKIQSLNIKDRFKEMRRIANDICDAFSNNDNLDIEKLEFYMNALKAVNRMHDLPRSKRALSKMVSLWSEMKGYGDVKILNKVAGKINTETASIAVCDLSFAASIKDAYEKYVEKEIIHLINQGEVYTFSTGIDGLQNVQIRIVDAAEPVLSSKELKCVMDATEIAIINVATGRIVVADPSGVDVDHDRILMEVEPGIYKICVYLFSIPSKVESFYIALSKTNEDAKNNLSRLPNF